MNKLEILQQALESRAQEVLLYQINIDNYTMAIQEIDASGDESMAEFRNRLVELLSTETAEQKKAQVLLTVIQKQVDALTA